MPHVLTQVRVAAVAALNGLPSTGARVYVQEAYPWPEATLPALLVGTACAPEADYMDGELVLRWDVDLTVTAIAKGTGDLGALLDDIATEVAGALCGLASIGGKAVQVQPTLVEALAMDGGSDQPVARRAMTYTVRSLYTLAVTPDTLLD
jgi:hypothetical protein